MKRLLLLTGLLASPLLALADASGTWTATFETQIGEQSYTLVDRQIEALPPWLQQRLWPVA